MSTEVAEPLERLEDGFWGVGGLGQVEAVLSELDRQLRVVVGLQYNRTLERHEHQQLIMSCLVAKLDGLRNHPAGRFRI